MMRRAVGAMATSARASCEPVGPRYSTMGCLKGRVAKTGSDVG